MRDYGKLHVSFWTSPTIRSMSEDGRTLAGYLLTSPHTTMIGAFRLPDGYACDDLQWTSERVQKGFAELFEKGFANRCETTKWVWVRKFLDWNEPENPNQWKAARKAVAHIPDQCVWRTDFVADFARRAGDPPPNPSNPSPTVPGPFRNQEQEQKQEQKQEQESQSAATRLARTVSRGTSPDWLLDFKLAYPPRAGDQGWRRAAKAGHARVAEGHDPLEFIEGARRYARYIAATGKTGTEYVKQAATFLGPEKPFLEPWEPPASAAQRNQDRNVSAAQQWLQQGTA